MNPSTNPDPTPGPHAAPQPDRLSDGVGLVIVGDEILSGKRADQHLPRVIELLGARGLRLAWAEYVGDDPVRLTAALHRAFASGGLVFSCGGIGATPDDHTRQCAARALGVDLALHPQAAALIRERIADLAREKGLPVDTNAPEHDNRLQMGVFPVGARIIPNPYNKIPGFSCGHVHFVPGFPVMAWPMIEQVLDTHYRALFHTTPWIEQSVIVMGAMESTLTPLMTALEQAHPGIKVFSLPSVDHAQWGPHIELGVKGPEAAVALAYPALLAGLGKHGARLGPELVRR